MSLSSGSNQSDTLDQLSDLGLACTGQDKTTLPAWTSDALSGRFSEALIQVESQLQESPESAETKLWWVRCQLESGTVPVAALTGPLEEIIPRMREAGQLRMLVSGTCLKMARTLLKRKQPRLALTLMEHAVEFALDNPAVSPEQVRALHEFVVETITREMHDAPLRREAKSYLTYLAEKEVHFKRQLTSLATTSNPIAVPAVNSSEKKKSKNRFNSKSILEEAAQATKPDAAWALGQDAASVPVAVNNSNSSTQRALLFIVCTLLVFSGLGASWLWVFSPEATPISESLAMNTSGPDRLEPLIPAPKTAHDAAASKSSHDASLDKLGKRLQEMAFAKNGAPPPGESAEAKAAREERQQVDKDALSPKNGKKLPNLRSESDDELESLGGMPDAENAINENKLPTLNPDKFAKAQVENMGSSERKKEVDGVSAEEVHVGSDGRAYGPPQDSDPYAEPGRKALDGSPLQSYEVQRFDPPLLYRTLTATEVLTAPSLLSQSLARLDANTPIHVTSKVGQWLELVSSGGRVGYIYAQDASSAVGK